MVGALLAALAPAALPAKDIPAASVSTPARLVAMADAGSASAQLFLGAAYAEGKGVPQSDRQAAYWFRKAADQGSVDAQFFLAGLYLLGRGVPQNLVMAAALFDAADAGGLTEAGRVRATLAKRMTSGELRDAMALGLTFRARSAALRR